MRIFSGNFFNYFRPDLFVTNISKINIDRLKLSKIKLAIVDLDNTLAPHFSKKPTKYAQKFISNLKKQGIYVVIASNNTKKRVHTFCKHLDGVDKIIHNANKPFSFKLKNVFKEFQVVPEQSVVIGDQFVTDIWVANNLKTKSILVTSLFNINLKQTKKIGFKYFIENYIYENLQRKNMINSGDISNIILGTDEEIL